MNYLNETHTYTPLIKYWTSFKIILHKFSQNQLATKHPTYEL